MLETQTDAPRILNVLNGALIVSSVIVSYDFANLHRLMHPECICFENYGRHSIHRYVEFRTQKNEPAIVYINVNMSG